MKIGYNINCWEHGEDLTIINIDTDSQGILCFSVKPCSQCQSESHEKGIESLLSKGYARNEGEI